MKDQLISRVLTKSISNQSRKMEKLQLFKYHLKQRVSMDWVDKPPNYKDLYGILQILRGSHLNNFPRKFLKLGWVALHSVTFQLKCLDFLSNQYKKLVPVLSRFCNCLLVTVWGCIACIWRCTFNLTFILTINLLSDKQTTSN